MNIYRKGNFSIYFPQETPQPLRAPLPCNSAEPALSLLGDSERERESQAYLRRQFRSTGLSRHGSPSPPGACTFLTLNACRGWGLCGHGNRRHFFIPGNDKPLHTFRMPTATKRTLTRLSDLAARNANTFHPKRKGFCIKITGYTLLKTAEFQTRENSVFSRHRSRERSKTHDDFCFFLSAGHL